MPRKKDGMPFEVHPTPATNADGRHLMYVRPKSGMKVTLRYLDEYCANNYAMRSGELRRALDVFMQASAEFLAEGCLKAGYTTVRHYAAQAGLTYYSAQKQLDAWTQGDRPKLLKTRMGRQYLYTEI